MKFLYNKDKNIDGAIRWKCQKRRCSGSNLTNNSKLILKQTKHNYSLNFDKVVKLRILYKIKEKAVQTRENAHILVLTITMNI